MYSNDDLSANDEALEPKETNSRLEGHFEEMLKKTKGKKIDFTYLRYLESEDIEALFSIIKRTEPNVTAVESIESTTTGLKDKIIISLLENLKSSQLKKINLHGNYLTAHGVKKLVEHLKAHPLRKLNLGCNGFQEGVRYLSDLIKQDTLISLNLNLNHIEDRHLVSLFKRLGETKITQLKELNLDTNHLGILRSKLWIEPLGLLPITKLGLSENKLDYEDATYLLEKLGHQLKVLDLSNNKIGKGSGINPFYEALKNSTLKDLDLSNCCIEKNELKQLIENLDGTKLTTLNLSGNKFTTEDYRSLAGILKKTNIKKLTLNQPATVKGTIALMEALEGSKVNTLIFEDHDNGDDEDIDQFVVKAILYTLGTYLKDQPSITTIEIAHYSSRQELIDFSEEQDKLDNEESKHDNNENSSRECDESSSDESLSDDDENSSSHDDAESTSDENNESSSDEDENYSKTSNPNSRVLHGFDSSEESEENEEKTSNNVDQSKDKSYKASSSSFFNPAQRSSDDEDDFKNNFNL